MLANCVTRLEHMPGFDILMYTDTDRFFVVSRQNPKELGYVLYEYPSFTLC